MSKRSQPLKRHGKKTTHLHVNQNVTTSNSTNFVNTGTDSLHSNRPIVYQAVPRTPKTNCMKIYTPYKMKMGLVFVHGIGPIMIHPHMNKKRYAKTTHGTDLTAPYYDTPWFSVSGQSHIPTRERDACSSLGEVSV